MDCSLNRLDDRCRGGPALTFFFLLGVRRGPTLRTPSFKLSHLALNGKVLTGPDVTGESFPLPRYDRATWSRVTWLDRARPLSGASY